MSSANTKRGPHKLTELEVLLRTRKKLCNPLSKVMLYDEGFTSKRMCASQVDEDLDEMAVQCDIGEGNINNCILLSACYTFISWNS